MGVASAKVSADMNASACVAARGECPFIVWAPLRVAAVVEVVEGVTPLPEASHRPRDGGFPSQGRF